MRRLMMLSLAAAALAGQAHAGQFYYKPGDRLPFWYKNVESTVCPANRECNGVGLGGPVIVLETTIADIIDPNTDHAKVVTVEGSCMRRATIGSLGTEMSLSETCGKPGIPIDGISTVAIADCRRGVMMALSGLEYAVSPSRPDDDRPYIVEGVNGKPLSDGARLRATVEQFKAMCPLRVIGWQVENR